MNTILLYDADGSIFQSCLDKKENTEDNLGFIYNLDDALLKFENKIMHTIDVIEKDYDFQILHTVLFLEGQGNFRKAFNKSYKANRKEQDRPPLLNTLRDEILTRYSNDEFSTFKSINVETDDSLAATFMKYHLNDYGIQLIVVSPDKDLKTVPCLLFDNYYTRNELTSITELEAKRNLYTQMLVGDAADNIKGIKRMGKVGAEKLLKNASSEFAMKRMVYAKYQKQFKRRAKEEYLKAWFSLQLNTEVYTPELDAIMFNAIN